MTATEMTKVLRAVLGFLVTGLLALAWGYLIAQFLPPPSISGAIIAIGGGGLFGWTVGWRIIYG